LEQDRGHLAANYLKGRIHLKRRAYAEAVERFSLVVTENPRNPMAFYFRALGHMGQGETKLAETDLLKAVELNPGIMDARLILADMYIRDKSPDLARQQVEKVLEIRPNHLRAISLSGAFKLLERDVQGAEAAFKRVIALNPDYAPGHMRLGLLYNLTGRKEKALEAFQKALALAPFRIDALTAIVGIYLRDKKYEAALELCDDHKQTIGEKKAFQAAISAIEGDIFMAKGDTTRAEAAYNEAIEIHPNILVAYVALARIYERENRLDEAISKYEDLLEKRKTYLPAIMSLGVIYERKGDLEKAETFYRKALDIKKDFGPAANNLAWTLAEGGGNIDEALGFAQIAKEQMPNVPGVMDTLGWIYYLKESYLNAIAEFQDALSRDPDNPVINYHMGLAYYKNEQPEKAEEYLQKAVESDPDFEGAEEARRVLKELRAHDSES
jgi:tetratricopeptide (TPR) repeat protein